MSTLPIAAPQIAAESLPYKGRVAMWLLIGAESAIFTIFVVAYVYYIGLSLSGPTPSQVLDVPVLNTIFLLSSSLTIWLAERAKRLGGAWNPYKGVRLAAGLQPAGTEAEVYGALGLPWIEPRDRELDHLRRFDRA